MESNERQPKKDGVIRPFKLKKPPAKQDEACLHFFRYHQYVGHTKAMCQDVRMMFHTKINDGTHKLPMKK